MDHLDAQLRHRLTKIARQTSSACHAQHACRPLLPCSFVIDIVPELHARRPIVINMRVQTCHTVV